MARRKLEEPLYAVGDYVMTNEPTPSIDGGRTKKMRRAKVASVMPDTGCGVAYMVMFDANNGCISKHPWMRRTRAFKFRGRMSRATRANIGVLAGIRP